MALTHATVIYGLNLYTFCLTNPVNMVYNGYTIDTNTELVYDPPELTIWQNFTRGWNAFRKSDAGKVVGILMVGAGFLLGCICPGLWPYYFSALIGAGISVVIGGVVNGISNAIHGDNFWDGFGRYINENWAQTVAISMAIAMISFGISQASQAIANSRVCNAKDCFIAGTLVLCRDEDGNECHKPIEDIEVGDQVWAYDEETGECDWKPVVRLFRNETKEWYHITVNGEEIVCTGGHPFYVVEVGFVFARDLKTGDLLQLENGEQIPIKTIYVQKLDHPETIYNFEVQDFHTYYVTRSDVLVHNKCIFDELGVKDFYEVTEKYTPDELINKLDEIGYSKSISLKNPHSPAVEMLSPDGKYKFRIQTINPQGGTPYFRVFNSGNGGLAANGLFPSWASRAEQRALTHFYFVKG